MDRIQLDIDLTRGDVRLALTLALGAETFALLGPSGAGKSTLVRAVCGLERPDRGRIVIDGTVMFDSESGVDVPPEARGVGVVFQNLALFPHLTVAQNVAYGGADVDDLLRRFAIAHLADERPGNLSGGEQRRVAVARAFARRPAAVLMDEPLSGLDTLTRVRVRGELAALLPRLSIPAIVVTHDFEDARAIADRVGVLVDGGLRQVGTPDELMRAPADAVVATLCGVSTG